jgi:hypothetical protein
MQIAFAHMCEANSMGEFTREEFCRGCDALGVSTIEALTEKVPLLRKRFDNDEVFDEMYNYVFLWACPKGKRCDTEPKHYHGRSARVLCFIRGKRCGFSV